MAKPLHVQIIPRARALIEDEDHWCRGGLARDKYGVSVLPTDSEARRRCAFGALIAAAHEATGDMRQAYEFAIRAMGRLAAPPRLSPSTTLKGTPRRSPSLMKRWRARDTAIVAE